MARPKKQEPASSDYSESSSEEEQFQVEVILKARVGEDAEWEYYVKWAGFGEDANSWEPEANLEGCQRLRDSFWLDIGMDEDHYPIGHVAEASKEWIAREKKYFASTFDPDPKPEKKKKRKKKDPIAFTTRSASSSSKKEAKLKPLPVDPDTSSSDSDDQPLKKPKKRPVPPSSDESDSKPLRKSRKVKPHVYVLQKVKKEREPPAAGSKRAASDKGSTSHTKTTDIRQSSVGSSSKGSTSGKGKGRDDASQPKKTKQPGASASIKGKERADPTSLFSGGSAPSSPDVALKQLPAEEEAPKSNLPHHIDKKVNPRVKLLDIPTQAGSGISIKQRLMSGMSPINTSVPTQTAKKTLPSFKKKAAGSGDPRTPISPQIPSAGPSSAGGFGGFTDKEVVQSPVDAMQVDHDSTFPTTPSLPLPRGKPTLPLPRRTSGPTLQAQAEDFLADIMPPELAAPLHEDAVPKEPPRPTKPAALPKIQKKWRWDGQLHVQSDKESTRHLCNITLNEASDPRQYGLQFKICLKADQTSLYFKKMHDVAEIFPVLSACAAVTQHCQLIPKEEADSSIIKTLEAYMKKKRFFTYAALYLDDEPESLLFVYPSSFDDIASLFKLPANLRSKNGLAVSLCPWKLHKSDLDKFDWIPKKIPFQSDVPGLDPELGKALRHGRSQPQDSKALYQLGLRILKFPKRVHDYMCQPNRRYSMWYGKQPHVETKCLQAILERCGAKDVGLKADLEAIFIHVGHLSTMHHIQVMALRRNKQPHVRYFTYGTHETVHPSRWGVREVYPVGGIVTFTTAALWEGPVAVYRLIDLIDRHPLWSCFITPVVVGALATLSSKGTDPLTLFDQNESFCGPILSLIEEGKISVLTSPPRIRHPTRDEGQTRWNDAEMAWVKGQLALLPATAKDILSRCLDAFNRMNVPESDIHPRAASNALKEMYDMQFQPAIMDEYRRYVVVKGSKEVLEDKDDLVEITALTGFDFKDMFFADPSVKRRAPADAQTRRS
ncbi:hypothetical protein EIP91_005056 [Steccherinum ochraceum]|uniref:Chromo domain-containing protein n=1 Tax=Steccherinum ochraceum TaxID=92696 RepID=A0A4R0S1M8_9APHY|nr:hypothetical protein EIP91_005056 [Steccherinum ochraceum]